MKVNEKIKDLRKSRGLSQEKIAEKLDMSANGYGGIERGEVDIKLSRLEKLSEIFGVELIELLQREQNVFNFSDTTTQHHWNISSKSDDSKLKYEIKKLQLVIEKLEFMLEAQKAEISYLKEIIELMKK